MIIVSNIHYVELYDINVGKNFQSSLKISQNTVKSCYPKLNGIKKKMLLKSCVLQNFSAVNNSVECSNLG